jgi:hypothetical protein
VRTSKETIGGIYISKRTVVKLNGSTIDVSNLENNENVFMYHKGHFGVLTKHKRYTSGFADLIDITYSMIVLDINELPWTKFCSRNLRDVVDLYLNEGAEIYKFDTFAEAVAWMNEMLNYKNL